MRKILIYLFAFAFLANSSYAGITFWTTEVQPARMEKQKEMAKAFEAKSGISVEVIPVEEKDLGKRATAAAAAGDLPDVIYHTLQYVLPWAEAGILDVNANNAVVKSLGKNTEYLGFISNEEVANILKKTSILIVPSIWQEPFALTALEGVCNGAAVIASKVGGMQEMLEDVGLLISDIAVSYTHLTLPTTPYV